ncbi:MAG: DUF3990 domain-containing protein [Clostridia bacterium]|nr:DUF3990 domain-containing protein [Clostridia bacterium]
MILYHTSDREIRNPDIRYGRKNADFGQGFYLTPDRDFTYHWAGKDDVVNVYDLDETGLDLHTFSRSAEWFQYIFDNRRMKDSLTKDAVIGPIANDTIFDTFGIISSGFLKPADAMKLLMIGPEYTQVAVKTEKAAKRLRWLGAERIDKQDAAMRRAEQEAYGAQAARAIREIIAEMEAREGF